MKIHVIADKCQGHNRCYALAPELFDVDDYETYVRIQSESAIRHVASKYAYDHGEEDEIVPLADVLAWARPQGLPVIVFPGGGHFFHGRLPQLQRTIAGLWHGHAVAPGA